MTQLIDERRLSIDLRIGEALKVGDNFIVTLEEKSGRLARLRFVFPDGTVVTKFVGGVERPLRDEKAGSGP